MTVSSPAWRVASPWLARAGFYASQIRFQGAAAARRRYLGWSVMIPLSARTRAHVRALFDAADVDAAVHLLQQDCSESLRLPAPTAESLERVRFAVIRSSGGTLHGLGEALTLANLDWRDLLVSTGFADDVHAHASWRPARFDRAVLEAWFAGEHPSGVQFGLGDSVLLASGNHQGRPGRILSLVGLEPEPRYVVDWESGKQTEAWQHTLETPS